jgi:hypothetical protein
MRLPLALLLLALALPASAAELNDYPTSTRADYVFGCMKANGDTRQSLDQCSCSIDVIATILPFERYVAAETVASLEQQMGQVGSLMRNTAIARDALDELREAEAETHRPRPRSPRGFRSGASKKHWARAWACAKQSSRADAIDSKEKMDASLPTRWRPGGLRPRRDASRRRAQRCKGGDRR